LILKFVVNVKKVYLNNYFIKKLNYNKKDLNKMKIRLTKIILYQSIIKIFNYLEFMMGMENKDILYLILFQKISKNTLKFH